MCSELKTSLDFLHQGPGTQPAAIYRQGLGHSGHQLRFVPTPQKVAQNGHSQNMIFNFEGLPKPYLGLYHLEKNHGMS